MAEIIITEPLLKEIQRRFSVHEAHTVIDLMEAVGELATLLIKFVKMSDKKDQQQSIDRIKDVLRSMGFQR